MMAVHLHGGVGNQLFQVAFGEWLAERYTVVYYTLLSDGTPGPTTRALQVAKFVRSRQRICVPYSVSQLLTRVIARPSVQRLLGNRVALLDLTRVTDWPQIATSLDRAASARLSLLTGYFQFSSLVEMVGIHRDPGCQAIVSRACSSALQSLKDTPDLDTDCLLHVRVGDYRRHGFPICGTGYFRAALETLRARGFCGRVFVVSDDPSESAQILKGIPSEVLAVDDPLEVLGLVAGFRYKVISNSTLSLWGALFGESKACVFPDIWPANSGEFMRIGSMAGWTLLEASLDVR